MYKKFKMSKFFSEFRYARNFDLRLVYKMCIWIDKHGSIDIDYLLHCIIKEVATYKGLYYFPISKPNVSKIHDIIFKEYDDVNFARITNPLPKLRKKRTFTDSDRRNYHTITNCVKEYIDFAKLLGLVGGYQLRLSRRGELIARSGYSDFNSPVPYKLITDNFINVMSSFDVYMFTFMMKMKQWKKEYNFSKKQSENLIIQYIREYLKDYNWFLSKNKNKYSKEISRIKANYNALFKQLYVIDDKGNPTKEMDTLFKRFESVREGWDCRNTYSRFEKLELALNHKNQDTDLKAFIYTYNNKFNAKNLGYVPVSSIAKVLGWSNNEKIYTRQI